MIAFWMAGALFTLGMCASRKDMDIEGFWHGAAVFLALMAIWPVFLGVFMMEVLQFWGMKFEVQPDDTEEKDGNERTNDKPDC